MGDSKRFHVMADFLARNYKPCHVADVAGGMGLLSLRLIEMGFDSTVIDPRKSNLPCRERRVRRREIRIARIRKRFRAEMSPDFDVIVGLHPDEATAEIARAATFNKSIVLVPCCNYWEGQDSYGSPSIEETVRRFWRRHGVRWWETRLPMRGKNLVMVSHGCTGH